MENSLSMQHLVRIDLTLVLGRHEDAKMPDVEGKKKTSNGIISLAQPLHFLLCVRDGCV